MSGTAERGLFRSYGDLGGFSLAEKSANEGELLVWYTRRSGKGGNRGAKAGK